MYGDVLLVRWPGFTKPVIMKVNTGDSALGRVRLTRTYAHVAHADHVPPSPLGYAPGFIKDEFTLLCASLGGRREPRERM